MAGPLLLDKIGKVIAGLLQDLTSFDNRIKVLEDQMQIGVDPPIPQAGFSNPLSPLTTYPVKVTSVNTTGCYFLGRMITTTGTDCSPWTVDTLITSPIRVDVTTISLLPEVDEYVPAIFLGTYGSSYTPRYGFFPSPAEPGTEVNWYKLAGNLSRGSTATANRVVWATTTYTVVATTVTLRDYSNTRWGLKNEWLIGRAVGSGHEVLAAGKEMHVATLAADLTTGSSAAASVTVNGSAVALTVYDHTELGMEDDRKILSGTKVRIWYDVPDNKWYADWTKCGNVLSTYVSS